MLRGARALCAIALLCTSCAGSPADGASGPAASRDPISLRLTTGPVGGGFYPLGQSVGAALRRRMPGVRVSFIDSGGAIFNIHAIQNGLADVGFTFADVAYMGYNGLLEGQTSPLDRLRGVSALQLIPITLVARRGLTIRDPSDLVGRRVSIGPGGSGTALTAQLILHEFGVEPSAVQTQSLNFDESATRLLDGSIDAMFDNAIIPGSVRRATMSGARLVPIVGPAVDRLRQAYPFVSPVTIPGGTYPNAPAAVHTVGVGGLLICREGLDPQVVYELTRQFLAIVSSAGRGDPLASVDLDTAPATPIPLHRGAARYYRERELIRQH